MIKSINALEAMKRIAQRYENNEEYIADYDEAISVLKSCQDDGK
jgi:hypothetical protein